MTKRLQVLLCPEEYADVQDIARGSRMTASEWVRQSLRAARERRAEGLLHESPAAYFTHSAEVYYTANMTKRLQVILSDEELEEIQDVARGERMTVADWVRSALRAARHDRPGAIDAKLRALGEAYRHDFPTGDVDAMLSEIEAGRR